MNRKNFYKLAIHLGAAPADVNFVVKRDDFVAWMLAQGYAERTINNHAAPSRSGGIINQLITDGLIEEGGVKRWLIPCVAKLNSECNKKARREIVRLFAGSPPTGEGWVTSARLDDESDQGQEWRLYRREYAPGCNNLKVAAIKNRVQHKANYWLSSKDGKLAMTKNAVLLKQHRPNIFENLCESIKELNA